MSLRIYPSDSQPLFICPLCVEGGITSEAETGRMCLGAREKELQDCVEMKVLSSGSQLVGCWQRLLRLLPGN